MIVVLTLAEEPRFGSPGLNVAVPNTFKHLVLPAAPAGAAVTTPVVSAIAAAKVTAVRLMIVFLLRVRWRASTILRTGAPVQGRRSSTAVEIMSAGESPHFARAAASHALSAGSVSHRRAPEPAADLCAGG